MVATKQERQLCEESQAENQALNKTASSLSFAQKSVVKNEMKKAKCVTCDPQVARTARGFAYHSHTLMTCHLLVLRSSLCSSPQIFEQKRAHSQSMSSTTKFVRNVREKLFLY